MAQEQQDNGQLVLQPQEHAHADVLQKEEGGERHPEQGGQQAAAKVEEEAEKAVHAARAQVQVKVVVLGAHKLGSVGRPAGRVHAGGVGAMEAAHPPWDGDHRHGWATGAQHGALGLLASSSTSAASWGAACIICLDHLTPRGSTC